MEKIEIAPTNLNKFEKAVEKISEASGLLQTCNLGFKLTRPCVNLLMGVLEQLSVLQDSFEVVSTGKGRRPAADESEGSDVLTPDELARLETEAANITPEVFNVG